jgi:hypothetical protein
MLPIVTKFLSKFKHYDFTPLQKIVIEEDKTITSCKRSFDELMYSLKIHDFNQVEQSTKEIKNFLFKIKNQIDSCKEILKKSSTL